MYKENGVWLDIYKLTKSKHKDVELLILQEHLDYLNRRCQLGCISVEERNRRVGGRDLVNKIKHAKMISSKSNDESDVYIIWSASKIMVEPEWCFPLSKCIFENIDVTTFCQPEAYLVRHYGEGYKSLPPDEMRRVGINSVIVYNG